VPETGVQCRSLLEAGFECADHNQYQPRNYAGTDSNRPLAQEGNEQFQRNAPPLKAQGSGSGNLMDPNEARSARDEDASAGPPGKSRSRWAGLITPAVFVALFAAAYQLNILNERAAPSAGPGSGVSSAPFQFDADPLAILLPVPDLKFVDDTGRSLSLSDFKGRLVLLNVWATWCPPCREEMPSLDRLQSKFDRSKFLVLALSIDRAGLPAIREFYKDLGLKSLGVYLDQTGAALHQLGSAGIPATVLINPAGLEIGRKIGPAKWDDPQVTALVEKSLAAERPQEP
jgi:thiol-disulfide isomerase/thioredoxin